MTKENNGLKEISTPSGNKSGSLRSSFKTYLKDWEISGYVITNAISSGAFLVLFVGMFLNHILEQPFMTVRPSAIYSGTLISLVFLVFTALLISKDIKSYKRFVYGMLHPDKGSRFVLGAYAILLFGVLTTLFAISIWYKFKSVSILLIYTTAFSALAVSLSTTYLLDQPKGKSNWNFFGLSLHMLVHSFMAGGAAFSIVDAFFRIGTTWGFYVDMVLHIAIISNLFINIFEMFLNNNPYQKQMVKEVLTGNYKTLYWIGNILIGNIFPFIMIFFSDNNWLQTGAGILILIGIFITDRIWIATPNRVKFNQPTIEVINN